MRKGKSDAEMFLTSEPIDFFVTSSVIGDVDNVAQAIQNGPPQNVKLILDDGWNINVDENNLEDIENLTLSEDDINKLLQAMVDGKKTFRITTDMIFTKSSWDVLMKLVETQRLESLQITNNLTPARIQLLINALRSIPRPSMDITINGVGESQPIDFIVQIISRVSQFSWDGKLTDQDAFKIANTIEQSPFLKRLYLSLGPSPKTVMSDKGIQRLLEAFQNTKTLANFQINTFDFRNDETSYTISPDLLQQFLIVNNERSSTNSSRHEGN